MAIRTTCPACDASLSFDEEKRGKKVRCRKCEETFVLREPKGSKRKRAEDEAVQDSRTMKAKATRPRLKDRDDVDGDDDDRPAKKKKKKIAKAGLPLGLILGGVGAAVFLLLVVAGGIGGYFMFRKPAPAPIDLAAKKNDDANPPHVVPAQKKIEPEKKQEPVKNNEPIRNANSDQLTPEAVARVKAATVYLLVRMSDGQKAEGSGFFCVEPGLVITNAHVVGMLQPKAPRPTKIDVVLNSGLPNELTTVGELLGVDRVSDLAVLRVAVANAPPPLSFGDQSKLFETQKVFISGFPLGRSLGKDITINPSAISSLRKDGTGMLEQIQVNGGMSPGNSGGPVISPDGNLVGVAVAGIKGTQINFAIPGDFVKRLMEGRVGEVTTGDTFLQNGLTKLPVKVTALDPLNKIRSMRVEVWTGMPGQPRPLSYQPPAPLPGDSMRQPQQLSYQTGLGSADVTVPAAPPGQVYWLQPVITTADGKTQWGVAVSTTVSISSPLERKPADLTVNLTAQKERTVSLKSTQGITIPEGKIKHVIAAKVEVDMLEVMHPDPKGSRIKTAMGTTASYIDVDGDKKPAGQQSVDIVRQGPPHFVIDNTNKLHDQITRKYNPGMPLDTKKEIERTVSLLCNGYQAVNLPMPNRVVQPAEKWNTMVPLIVGTPPKTQVVDLVLTCTYEGIRTRDQRSEGLITVTGIVKGRSKFKGKGPAQPKPQGPADEVSGKIAFDLVGGFISFAQLKITSEGEFDTIFFDIDLTRSAGNTKNLVLAQEKDAPPNPKDQPAAGKLVLQQAAALLPTDPLDPTQPKKKVHYKEFVIPMQAGKTYTIVLNSNGFPGQLRVFAPTGALVAQNGGIAMSRVTYQATAPGFYRINVSSNNAATGQFQITATESP